VRKNQLKTPEMNLPFEERRFFHKRELGEGMYIPTYVHTLNPGGVV
jgi:hypothetical protein